MQTQKKKSQKLLLYIAVGAVVLAVAAVAYVLIAKPFMPVADDANQPSRPVNSVDYGPLTEAEKKESDQRKQDIIDQQNQSQTTPAAITITVVRAAQNSPGQPLGVRTIVNGASQGSCTLSLTRAGQTTVTKTASIVPQATYSSCQPVDIPAVEFSAEGEWTLQVKVVDGSRQSEPVTQNVTIEK